MRTKVVYFEIYSRIKTSTEVEAGKPWHSKYEKRGGYIYASSLAEARTKIQDSYKDILDILSVEKLEFMPCNILEWDVETARKIKDSIVFNNKEAIYGNT